MSDQKLHKSKTVKLPEETPRVGRSKRAREEVARDVQDPHVESVSKKVRERKERSRKAEVEVEVPPVKVEVVDVVDDVDVKGDAVIDESSFEVTTTSSIVRRLDKEEVTSQFDNIVSLLEKELLLLKEDKSKNRRDSLKFIRTLTSEIKRLKTNSVRLMKKTKKKTDGLHSGFMKPVKISREMSAFAGWNESELKSRVDVTKFICEYIKANNLQNPSDRRQILVDDKLGALLKYDPTTEAPLTYYFLQRKIQHHFV